MADYRASWEVGPARDEARDRGWGSPLPAGYGTARRYPPAVDRSSSLSNGPDGPTGRAGRDPVVERLAKLKVGLLRSLVRNRPARRAPLFTGWNLRGGAASPATAPSVLDGSGGSGGSIARAALYRSPGAGPSDLQPSDSADLAGYPESPHGETIRQVTYIDVYSVAKVSMVFYVILLVVFVVASILLWLVADAFGAVDSIQRSIRSLFDVKTFVLHPVTIALYTSAFGAVLAVAGTIANVLGAVIYNLISEVVGGIRIGVLAEDTGRLASPAPASTDRPGRSHAVTGVGDGSVRDGSLREAGSDLWRRRAR